MRRILLTLFTVLTVSGGLAAASITSAVPEASAAVRPVASPEVHAYVECNPSGNACEEVYNYDQGSDYVYYVEVWDNNPSFYGTYRLLVNGSIRYIETANGGILFNLGYFVNSGNCIQGGIVGLSDARTPCWNAP